MFDDSTAVGGKRHRLTKVYDTVEDAREGTALVDAEARSWSDGEAILVKADSVRRRDGKIVVSLEYDVWEVI